jgi:hypothetical protein
MVPADKPAQALVYLFQQWDEATQSHKTSTVYATLPVIHSGLGLPMYDSAKYVDAADLEGGIYDPRAAPKLSPVVGGRLQGSGIRRR